MDSGRTRLSAQQYGRRTSAQIAHKINRTAASVLQKARILCLNRSYGWPSELLDFIRDRHARGCFDTEIASAVECKPSGSADRQANAGVRATSEYSACRSIATESRS